MRYLCVTVTEASPEGERNLERLLDSLDRQGVEVDVVLVTRGCTGRQTRSVRGRVLVQSLPAPRQIALSVARNLALGHARRTELLDKADIVAFPDDDCRYPDGLLSRVSRHLADSQCDCVTGAYGPSLDAVDRRRFPLRDAPLTPGQIMRNASSGSMFFTRRVVRAIGDFDARLGLGAAYGAGEDADYLLRALTLGFAGVYRPFDVVVEHPYKAYRPVEYYLGNVAVLAKHARGGVGTRLLLARRLLGGVLLALRSQIPFAHLGRAVASSFALLHPRHQRPEAPDATP